MIAQCWHCVHYDYDNTTGIGDCLLMHEELDGYDCLDFYEKEDARNDAKLQFAPEGKN